MRRHSLQKVGVGDLCDAELPSLTTLSFGSRSFLQLSSLMLRRLPSLSSLTFGSFVASGLKEQCTSQSVVYLQSGCAWMG